MAPHSPRPGCCSDHSPSDAGSDFADEKERIEGEDQDWSEWTEEANGNAPALSLFGQETFLQAEQVLAHDKATHGVDLVLLAASLDFFERIRFINWIRDTKPAPSSLLRLDRNALFLQDDKYLKPVIEDDPLLQLDFDSLCLSPSSSSASPAPLTPFLNAPSASETAALLDSLRAQLADSHQALDELRKIVKDRVGAEMGLDTVAADPSYKLKPTRGEADETEGKGKARDDDSHYFESYAYNEIHEIMLKDKIRTDAYRDFILANPSIFKDAVVLDVGCGSGILSMFAAQSGAKKVYAVDASAVAHKAERNIKANGLSEVITVIKGKIEEIEIPEKVDVIVSEWMGYFLLYECMLDSVLSARDRFLKPTGIMVPSQCSIMLSLYDASSLIQERIAFWDNVYGYSMKAMQEEMTDEALIDVVSFANVVSDVIALQDIHTQLITVPELTFSVPFALTASRASSVHAFLGHFDTFFTTDGRLASAVAGQSALTGGEVFFTTGAQGTPTHWKQTLFLLKEKIEVVVGTEIKGQFTCSKNPENSRELIVEVTYTVKSEGVEGELKAQVWKVR